MNNERNRVFFFFVVAELLPSFPVVTVPQAFSLNALLFCVDWWSARWVQSDCRHRRSPCLIDHEQMIIKCHHFIFKVLFGIKVLFGKSLTWYLCRFRLWAKYCGHSLHFSCQVSFATFWLAEAEGVIVEALVSARGITDVVQSFFSSGLTPNYPDGRRYWREFSPGRMGAYGPTRKVTLSPPEWFCFKKDSDIKAVLAVSAIVKKKKKKSLNIHKIAAMITDGVPTSHRFVLLWCLKRPYILSHKNHWW